MVAWGRCRRAPIFPVGVQVQCTVLPRQPSQERGVTISIRQRHPDIMLTLYHESDRKMVKLAFFDVVAPSDIHFFPGCPQNTRPNRYLRPSFRWMLGCLGIFSLAQPRSRLG